MRVAKRQLVKIDGYVGGLNKDADPSRLKADELPEALNVNIGPRGEVTKRGGFIRHDLNLTNRITAMFDWNDNQPEKTEWLVIVGEKGNIWWTKAGDKFFQLANENLGTAPVSANTWPVGFAAAKGSLYVSSKRGANTKKWAGGVSAPWVDVPTVPKAAHLRWRFDQLFCANIVGAPSQMRISLPLQPEVFAEEDGTQAAIFDFETEDGTEINGLASSGDDLMVFKDHAIHILTGKVRSEFAKYRLDSLRGTVSPRSIKQVRGLIIFFDRDTGVWSWDGQIFTLISEKINDYILNNQSYNMAYRAAGHVRRDLYYLSLCWRGSGIPNRTFVFSTLTNAWSEWDIGWFDANRHNNKDMIAGIKDLEGVYEGPVAWTDVGVNYQVQIKTPWFTPGGPGSLARLRRVETSMKATGAATTMNLRQEYDTTPVLTRSFIANNPNKGAESDLIKNIDGFPRRADAHQLEYLTKDNKDFQLNATHMLFTVNEDVLGEHV